MKPKKIMARYFGIIFLFGILAHSDAQPKEKPDDQSRQQQKFEVQGDGGFGGGGFGFMGFLRFLKREAIVHRFDSDGDGKLNDEERKAARKHTQDTRDHQGPPRPSGRTSGKQSDIEGDLRASEASAPKENVDLYDEKTLRTIYLRFPNTDWYEELGDFYRTDVDVPADLIVDGTVYGTVGVRFRGNSSYFLLGNSEKKSFNVAIDYGDENRRLYGYKTLNLVNSHSDSSLIREVLYSRICRQYIPAPKVNFVKLVINGENWGIYINVQQFNKDFLRDWFGTKEGIRWKITPARHENGGLVYNGPNPADYKASFHLKTKDSPNAWQDLINLCKILGETPDDRLEAELNKVFYLDRALWLIALENIFIDNDGYISRGSDYALYQDPHGRFHMIPHDNNETFRFAGGGGPNMWPSYDPMLSPVAQEDNRLLPVISRLLAIPHLRARYLAHIRSIVKDWLDWRVLGPIITEYQSLIDSEVNADDKKLYTYEAFAQSQSQDYEGHGGFGHRGSPGFKRFVTERREFLEKHPEINKPTLTIKSVSHQSNAAAEAVRVRAEIGSEVDAVILYYATSSNSPFGSVPMFDDGAHDDGKAGDGVYGGDIPTFPPGIQVLYYVEARAVNSLGTTTFSPERTGFGALTYQVNTDFAKGFPVVINEMMARNTKSINDPQREYDDWIELYNVSDKEIDISGMHLSDNKDNPRKWTFPKKTTISPGGYLVVWADGDVEDKPGLHVNFKLSKGGETVVFTDRDERGNQLLDSIEFGKQRKDTAIGRFPDGSGEFRSLRMTPGTRNKL